jgi:competence protein ComEA
MDKVVYDLNSAPIEELIALPGMTPELAEKIRSGRPYGAVDDLKQVKGVSSKMLKEWRSQLRVNGHHEDRQPEALPDTITKSAEAVQPVAADAAPRIEKPVEIQSEAVVFPAEPISVINDQSEAMSAEIQEPVDYTTWEAEPEAEPEAALEAVEPATPGQDGFGAHIGSVENISAAPAPAGSPSVREVKQPGYITRTQAALLVFLSSFLTLLVAIGVTLGIFLLLNGGLTYASQSAFQRLDGQVSAVTSQAGELQDNLTVVQERLVVVDALSEQVTGVETEVTGLKREVDAASLTLERMTSQLSQLDEEVNALAERTNAFDSFLIGLQQLLEGLPGVGK